MGLGRKQIIFLALAAVVGIGMVLLARSLMSTPAENPNAQASSVATLQVLMARKDLPAGVFVNTADVEWRSWPSDAPTDGLLIKGKTATKDYEGAVVREGIKKGEPIMRGRVTMPNEGGFLSAVLSPGMRAVTIKISATSGVAGLIFPNDRVDVILTQTLSGDSDEAGGGARRISETVLENVRILALDQKTNDQKKEPKIASLATLEVTAKQAEKVALISRMGALSLVLRAVASETDVIDVPATPPANVGEDGATIVTGETPVTADEPAPFTMDSEVSKVHRIQIIRGGTASEVVVPGGR